MKKLSSASEFHDFEKHPLLIGTFTSPILREEDSANGEHKKGDLMGYEFEKEDGTCTIVGNSYMIAKSIEKSGIGHVMGVKFLGKTTNSKNQPVNRFEVIEFDGQGHEGKPFAEALAYYGKDAQAF